MTTDTSKDEVAEVKVQDPKDYAQNRRLKQIYDARNAVRRTYHEASQKCRSSKSKRYGESDFRREYAQFVVTYAIEVEPILVRSDSDLLTEQLKEHDQTIREVIDSNGKINPSAKQDYPDIEAIRWMRRKLDEELGRLGVGLDIDHQELPIDTL